MTKNQTATKSAKGATSKATTKKNEEVFNMANINMEELVSMITKSVIATLSQAEAVPTKATPKTTKTTAKTAPVKVSKVNPVKVAIEKEQKELAEKFNGKEYGSKTAGDFIAFYRIKENGSYTRIGHFNKVKGLFWFTKKSLAFRDWSYIKAQLTKYSNAADFARNTDRFAKAGIKCPSDFSKVNWETFLNSGVFC